jgi:predicted CXXCH cytochrome family protein
MHRMTRDANGAEVRAPFDGTRWRFKGDAVVLEQRHGARFLRVDPEEGEPKTYRVTRVIGGRTREDFAGVDENGGTQELVLPVSYVYSTRALRYKGYSVMVHERPGLRAGPVWSRACIFCHNTVPEMDRLLGAIAGPKSPRYQGESIDRWLVPDRRARVRVTDWSAFADAAAEEARRLGGAVAGRSDVAGVARGAIEVVRNGFDGASLLEVGIGCEACHGGARAHSVDPRVPASLVPKAPWLDVALPEETRAAEINRVCARCHQVLFSHYPFTWEGGRRDAEAGGSHINSGEARDFLLGGCSSALACTDCHDPHGGGGKSAPTLEALSLPSGNGVCTTCHTDLAGRDRLRAHSHHDPDGRGGACVACHMPRKNMGLEGVLTRYHRIGSPTDPERVLGDRPLECALCHSDKSVRSLVDAMEAWWPVRYPRERLEELYGSLDANAMRATLERGKPHEQVVAIATFGEARAREEAPLVAEKLLADYPLVREWAKRALVSILGRCDVDLAADDAAIAKQAASCRGAPLLPPRKADTTNEEPED